MTTRRSFLKLIAGSMLAPLLPAIAAASAPESTTASLVEATMRGQPLYLTLGNEAGPIAALGRQLIEFDKGVPKNVSFGCVTQTVTITSCFIENDDGSVRLQVRLEWDSNPTLFAGDTVTVVGAVRMDLYDCQQGRY